MGSLKVVGPLDKLVIESSLEGEEEEGEEVHHYDPRLQISLFSSYLDW